MIFSCHKFIYLCHLSCTVTQPWVPLSLIVVLLSFVIMASHLRTTLPCRRRYVHGSRHGFPMPCATPAPAESGNLPLSHSGAAWRCVFSRATLLDGGAAFIESESRVGLVVKRLWASPHRPRREMRVARGNRGFRLPPATAATRCSKSRFSLALTWMALLGCDLRLCLKWLQ